MPSPTGEVQRAADAILARIVAGAYPPGLRLPPESTLAAELGLARSTLREALRHLSSLGLVASRRGSGVLVLDFRREGSLALLPAYLAAGAPDRPLPELVRELLRMRAMFAGEAARLAATHARPGALGPLRARLAALRALERDPLAHALGELDFFRELVIASEVWPAVWLANAFWGPARDIHARFAGAVGLVPPGFHKTMTEVVLRVEQHDADAAVRLLHDHFARVDGAIGERLDAALAPPARTPRRSTKRRSS